MTMVEKLISNKLLGTKGKRGFVKPGDAVLAQVDGGYSHEFTTAQVIHFSPKSMVTSILFLTPGNSQSSRTTSSTQQECLDLVGLRRKYRP